MSKKQDTRVLPSSYDCYRLTNSLYYYMRNNVCDAAHMLYEKLMGSVFEINGRKELWGGFPRMTMPRHKLRLDQILNTNFAESVGMYQALNANDKFRLNALNLFGVGWVLRPFAAYLSSLRFRLQLLIDGSICMMLDKFLITKLTTDVEINKSAEYHEVYADDVVSPVPVGTVDHERPKQYPYYGAMESGALLPEKIDGETVEYYHFAQATTSFKKCSVLKGTFYTLYNGEYYEIQDHVIGALNNKNIYRKKKDGTYENIGACVDNNLIILGKTRNITYTSQDENVIYRGLMATQDTKYLGQFYVDMENEDIALIKSHLNVILTHYSTILSLTGRKRPSYSGIASNVRYTLADLSERINNFIECLNSGDFPSKDTTKLDLVPEDEYTVRMLKLKINEIVDKITFECFFSLLLDESSEFYANYSLNDLLKKLYDTTKLGEEGWSDLLHSAERSNYQQQRYPTAFNGYSYNDLRVAYVPEDINKMTILFDYIAKDGLRKYNTGLSGTIGGEVEARERSHEPLVRDEGGSGDGYNPYEHRIPLSTVCDLPHIADVWRNCDYPGSMYIISQVCKLLNSKLSNGKAWIDVWETFVNERYSGNSATMDLLAQIKELIKKVNLILELAPVAAMMLTDLAFRTVDYCVVEEQRE